MSPAKATSPKIPRKSGKTLSAGLATYGLEPGEGFLAISKLKKSGGSLILTVPAAARNILGLTEGQEMAVSIAGAKVIAEPISPRRKEMKVRRPKYTLDELVRDYDSNTPLSNEEQAWMDAKPAGNETW